MLHLHAHRGLGDVTACVNLDPVAVPAARRLVGVPVTVDLYRFPDGDRPRIAAVDGPRLATTPRPVRSPGEAHPTWTREPASDTAPPTWTASGTGEIITVGRSTTGSHLVQIACPGTATLGADPWTLHAVTATDAVIHAARALLASASPIVWTATSATDPATRTEARILLTALRATT